MTTTYHKSVMCDECVKALKIHPEGIYVDATFGGGGHSRAILEQLNGGTLIAFDQDMEAVCEAKKIKHRSFIFCHTNFMYIKKYLKLHGFSKADGVLADLGVSSHQIDTPARGFSIRYDGPLDMRMNKGKKIAAADIVNDYTEKELSIVFRYYGEIKNYNMLARLIVRERIKQKIEKTSQLMAVIKSCAPRGAEFKYYARVFQALRIEVNKEMDALKAFLTDCENSITKGGRLVVLSYHSLEDRMVKNYMLRGKVHGELEKDIYGNPIQPFKAIQRKPMLPSAEEIEKNNRSRSAKFRVAERI